MAGEQFSKHSKWGAVYTEPDPPALTKRERRLELAKEILVFFLLFYAALFLPIFLCTVVLSLM